MEQARLPGPAELRGCRVLAPAECALLAAKLLLAELADAGGFLLLLFHARLFVVFAAAGLSEDAILLNALVEALERAFERLVFADDDFCQGVSPHLLAHTSCPRRGRRRLPYHQRGLRASENG